MTATYIQFKVKGKGVFIDIWFYPECKEIGGMIYSCGSYEKTSEALKGYVLKNADGNVLATIEDHGFKCSYTDIYLYLELFDPNGAKQKLKLYTDKSDSKYRPSVVIEA